MMRAKKMSTGSTAHVYIAESKNAGNAILPKPSQDGDLATGHYPLALLLENGNTRENGVTALPSMKTPWENAADPLLRTRDGQSATCFEMSSIISLNQR
jgi:hypothetical protein